MPYERDPEKQREHQRSYYERNRERVKARVLKNRLAKAAAGKKNNPTWDPAQSEVAGLDPIMTYDEIAAELGISKARVGQLIEKALRKLRALHPKLRDLLR